MTDGPGWLLEVDPASDGLRLDRFIAARIPRLSRARAARLHVVDIDQPQKALRKSTAVRTGQKIWASRPVPDQWPTGPEPTVLYENDGLLVLDKPPNWAVHPSASRFLSTVTHWLNMRQFGHYQPAHRLDVETSGILVCAAPHRVRHVSDCFAQRRAQKIYLAVVEGLPNAPEWQVKTPLGFDTRTGIRLKMGRGDLPAETHFRVRQTGTTRTLLEARPITGRQHQIRVHAQFSGQSLVGDKLYGMDDGLFFASKERALTAAEWASLGHTRHALHASQISLTLCDKVHTFESPIPEDMTSLMTE